MTRAIAVFAASMLIGPTLAAAQETPAAPQTLADVARAEEARRKSTKKATRVYTNDNLKPDTTPSRPEPPPQAPAAPSTVVPAVNLPGGSVPAAAAETRDQAYWGNRIAIARAAVERTKVLAAAMQSRINALTTDFVNRDDPAQRAVIQTDRQTALAELERLRVELAAQEAEILAIEDEARRAGVPSGWLRPGA
ncbi:MAG: hypothetical protein AB7P34_04075 [Vicinamibacterales bacterium]